ncbi:MAG TPA: OB-fold nucleic acid binding domain-containing protein [Mycobacteriales bacterium]|nr:OB-fold nucleic acid binding domain-containing protein [Mycobacteriales bacterium]
MTEADQASRAASTPRPERRGWWGRLVHRLVADDNELDAEALQTEVVSEGARQSCFCRRGEVTTVAGRLREVVYVPGEAVPTVQAELFDGTGSIRLIWLGRRRIAGIEPGRFLLARGRIARQPDGDLVIYNPWYELKPVGA